MTCRLACSSSRKPDILYLCGKQVPAKHRSSMSVAMAAIAPQAPEGRMRSSRASQDRKHLWSTRSFVSNGAHPHMRPRPCSC